MKNIELHIPGLLAVPARHAGSLHLPETAGLRNWCRQARVESIPPGRHGPIADLLGGEQPPLAALSWLGAHGELPQRQTFLASPAYLQAGLDDLVLFGGPGLEISATERARIAETAALHFGDEPALCETGGELFLQAPESLAVTTVPLHLAQGQAVRGNLPGGPDATRLHAWMNELQMLLHGLEFNNHRQASGQPPVNGLWIWGEGDVPADITKRSGMTVYAESLYMRGLGELLGRAVAAVDGPEALVGEGTHLIERSACMNALDADDTEAWTRAVMDIDVHWLQPLLADLRDGQLAEAVLYPGDGRAYRVGAGGWWRRLARRLRGRKEPELVTEV